MRTMDMAGIALRQGRDLWWDDGIPELCGGLWWLVMGGSFLLAAYSPLGIVFVYLAVPALLPAIPIGIKTMKRRVVEPRIGFVERRSRPMPAQILLGAMPPIVLLLGWFGLKLAWPPVASELASPFFAPVGLGTCTAILYLSMAALNRQPRFMVVAAVAALGPLMPRVGLVGDLSLGALGIAIGGAELLCGTCAMHAFLRAHPMPPPT